ncbi:hypothetical protein NM208_g15525 [Fusarium decemcellulare]|uniref:Uncharacterized protein n=1 Tax=Fusarium decemcellulare TaxID=57161 RepID=A0ACC1RG79_9HYPO|nr:hypothetical protein NM208_g15525 [Fusarium decemcellulare]
MGMGGIVQSNGTHPIKLLISHNQMGTIIGRQGLKIKHIQDASGVRMVAQKEMLPQSTERIVEVQGTPEGIQRAVWEICKCLVDDWQRGTGTVLYNPVVRTQPSSSGSVGSGVGYTQGSGRSDYGSPRVMRTGNGADFSNGGSRPYNRRSDSDAAIRGPPTHDENGEEIQTQNISIPADMVGCIIGRAGSKISEIRKTSGARISIAKASHFPFAPHDETGERMFTIMGTAKANESALFLLYENLEAEKMRRSQLQEPERPGTFPDLTCREARVYFGDDSRRHDYQRPNPFHNSSLYAEKEKPHLHLRFPFLIVNILLAIATSTGARLVDLGLVLLLTPSPPQPSNPLCGAMYRVMWHPVCISFPRPHPRDGSFSPAER